MENNATPQAIAKQTYFFQKQGLHQNGHIRKMGFPKAHNSSGLKMFHFKTCTGS